MPSFAEGWLAATGMPPGVHAGTVLRTAPGVSQGTFGQCNLGDRCGDEPAAVHRNRAALVDWLALPGQPLWLKQIHGTAVYRCSGSPGSLPEADAAVAEARGKVLAVLTADCLPVVLADQRGLSLAVAHAGWRGLLAGVIERTVTAMRCDSNAIAAWLGPAIGPASFEVGPEVREAFVRDDPQASEGFRRGAADRWLGDLYALASQRLRRCGVIEVSGGGMDTYRDREQCHSYRRDGPASGRMATLIWR